MEKEEVEIEQDDGCGAGGRQQRLMRRRGQRWGRAGRAEQGRAVLRGRLRVTQEQGAGHCIIVHTCDTATGGHCITAPRRDERDRRTTDHSTTLPREVTLPRRRPPLED